MSKIYLWINGSTANWPAAWSSLSLKVRGPKAILGLNLALASIQCFIVDSIASESPDCKSARCKAVTLGEIELFTF